MTITETTRRCPRCFDLLDGDQRECPRCGRTLPPHPSDWPEGARKLLFLLVIVDALATKLTASEEEQLCWLLENKMRGRFYEGRLLSYAATAAECYPEFVRLHERWVAAGSPTEFAAIAQLRGIRR